ncbi:hypothetical protein ACH95_15990 [Bacillus glycinifermentans]|uniref:DUF5655 domain-containing protein n=1 Tax=Bacillus glycinifermentans TaxID=1664069 RepID=A0A0J6EJ02_9BACI|nr:DUF5655 domain-containing protein [Bacillus glycinifermentans]ATH94659.1 hypothetical protein COP00_20440 [Bacillus glycinifermentans]KMM57280.1 hypothetical protein ACH95_15990 [Bacillus glycinifermentans]KRT93601.1 hypothetical protein AB447_217510 [Bacillus glycinifermentans]MEC0486048.1 DUF5655 domain-containing protein [Bacillus glycinifermentans]MEC0496633.1 DUF5655 domain-containing protein [Bacillus glycinifermentans]
MYLFQLHQQDLKEIREKPFKKEKDIQHLCEKNLKQLLGLRFIASEFRVAGFRIDTLAFDDQTQSFVIIEYKNKKHSSVIDQGYAYLSVMLNNKADFILEYNENQDTQLKRNSVDWSQSKVIFISPEFTTHQKESINFRDLPMELWEIKRYENNIIQMNPIRPTGASGSINTISKQSVAIEQVSREIKVFTEEDHLTRKPDEVIDLYQQLKEEILNLGDNLSIRATKLYIAFTINKRNMVDVRLLKKGLKIWINAKRGELDDPAGLMRDVAGKGHWGNGDYEVQINDEEHIEYIIHLIKQVYEKNI